MIRLAPTTNPCSKNPNLLFPGWFVGFRGAVAKARRLCVVMPPAPERSWWTFASAPEGCSMNCGRDTENISLL